VVHCDETLPMFGAPARHLANGGAGGTRLALDERGLAIGEFPLITETRRGSG
jgi:hypothetical protein